MKKSEEKLKIFVSCHKNSDFIDSKLFQPVQVNAENSSFRIAGAIPDNDGENISTLNPKFCELTAQYWAWKNAQKTKYVGFFHYRRYLNFSKKHYPEDVWQSTLCNNIDSSAVEKYGLDDNTILGVVENFDIILPKRRNIRKMPNMGKDMWAQYEGSGYLNKADISTMLEVLREKYPEYIPFAEKYLSGKWTYLNNIFIMRWDIFEDYSKWLFDVLFEVNNRIDYTNYSKEAIRTPGHLGERLFNIYILKLMHDHKQLRIKELQTVVFLKPEPLPVTLPAFSKNNIAVAMSANDGYVPYLATAINSIIENSSSHNNYDIIVMHSDIKPYNQERFQRLVSNQKNFSIRFIDTSRFSEKFEKLFLRGHFTIETWFRLLMPDLLPEYSKVLYIDADLVVNADLAELYKTNVKGYLLAACHDADTAGLYNGFEKKKKKYMDTLLKLANKYDYFQAGVILFNLDEFRKTYTVEYMLNLAASRKWQLLDQDVLNILADKKVKFVNMAWNVMFDWRYIRKKDIISLAPSFLENEYLSAHANPKIIHFAGPDKPWVDPMSDYADLFWHYAKGSLYYEEIIRRLSAHEAEWVTFHRRGFKFFVRKNIIDVLLPAGTRRRTKAIRFYLKLRGRA